MLPGPFNIDDMMQGADPRLDVGEHQLENAHRGQAGQQDGGGYLHQVSLEGKFLCER